MRSIASKPESLSWLDIPEVIGFTRKISLLPLVVQRMLFFYPFLFVVGFLPAMVLAVLLMRLRMPVAIMVTVGFLAVNMVLFTARMDQVLIFFATAWCVQILVLLPCYQRSREAKAQGKSRAEQWPWVFLGSFICVAAWGPVAWYLGKLSW